MPSSRAWASREMTTSAKTAVLSSRRPYNVVSDHHGPCAPLAAGAPIANAVSVDSSLCVGATWQAAEAIIGSRHFTWCIYMARKIYREWNESKHMRIKLKWKHDYSRCIVFKC